MIRGWPRESVSQLRYGLHDMGNTLAVESEKIFNFEENKSVRSDEVRSAWRLLSR